MRKFHNTADQQSSMFAQRKKKPTFGSVFSSISFTKKIVKDSDTEQDSDEPEETFQPIQHTRQWPYKNNIYLHQKESKAENFLKEVAISIDLHTLYEIKQVCYIDPKFELLGLLLRVKNRMLFNKGYGGKKYVLQIWNKKCVKVYEKALYRQPEMWSSNEFIVFKPHPLEAQGNVHDDTSGASSDEEKIYDSYSEDGEKGEGGKENTGIQNEDGEAAKPEPQELFHIIKGEGDDSREVIVKNWIPKPSEEDQIDEEGRYIVQAMFGKDILAVITKFKNYYARIEFDNIASDGGIYEVPKEHVKEYQVNSEEDDTDENLEIVVAFATQYITKEITDKKDFIEFQFALKKKDQQLHFVKSQIKFDGKNWVQDYQSITHNCIRDRLDQKEIADIKVMCTEKNTFVFADCYPNIIDETDEERNERVPEEGAEASGVVDVYMNGNRLITLDRVNDMNVDDQNLFVSKTVKERFTPEEFAEYEKDYNTYLGYGYSEKELLKYFDMDKPDFTKPMSKVKNFEISLDQGRNISWSAAKPCGDDGDSFYIGDQHLNSALAYAQPFSSFNLIGDSIYVTHSNFISRYSILQSKWISHMKFEHEIMRVLRMKKQGKANLKKSKTQKSNKEEEGGKKKVEESAGIDLCVMLKNFEVYKSVIKQFKKKIAPAKKGENVEGSPMKSQSGDEITFRTMPDNKRIFEAQDETFDAVISQDPTEGKMALIFTPHNEEIKLLNEGEIFSVEGLDDLDESHVVLCTPLAREPFIVQIHERVVTLYRLKQDPTQKKFSATQVSTAELTTKLYTLGHVHSACISDDYGSVLLVNENSFFNFKLRVKEPTAEELKEMGELDKEEAQKPVFQQSALTGSVKRTCSHDVKALYTKDQKHFYAIRKGNMDVEEGLAMYEARSVFEYQEGKDIKSSFLVPCQVGEKAVLDYSQSNTRLTFMKSLDKVQIIPLLHENTLSFFSMPDRENIVCIKRDTDIFYALTFESEIYGWDISTGKLISYFKVKDFDIKRYKHLANTEDNFFSQKCLKKEQVIICSKEPVTNSNEEINKYWPEFFVTNYGADVKNILSKQARKLHRMKVVEIMDGKNLRVVRQFKWPLADADGTQQTFISDSDVDEWDGKFLWERNEGDICYLYKWEGTTSENSTHGQYKFLRTLVNFPVRALPNTSTVSLHSPDLTKYFDPYSMTIKSMMTDKVLVEIPERVIEPSDWKKVVETSNKFQWINCNAFASVSKEGLERNFVLKKEQNGEYSIQEYGFTFVPYFDNEETENYHFYDEREPLSFSQTKERLQRKYLQYKRATLIHKMEHYYDQDQMKKWQEEAKKNVENIKKANEGQGGNEQDEKQKNKVKLTTKDQWPTHHERLIHMADFLYEIDTGFAELEDYGTVVQTSLPFTYLDWKLASQIRDGDVSIDDLTNDQVIQLLLNIFPDCRTILHYLIDTPEQFAKLLKRIEVISQVTKNQIDFPFTNNLNMQSPLHILEKRQDSKNMDLLLATLKNYGFDHHTRVIADMYGELIAADLPMTVEYFNSRMVTTKYSEAITEGILEYETALHISQAAPDKAELEKKIFGQSAEELKEDIAQNEIKPEKEQKDFNISNVELKLIDLPELHNGMAETKEFMNALASTDNFALFDAEPIQCVIDYLYGPIRKWTKIYLFYPYLVFLGIYFIYADFLVSNYKFSVNDFIVAENDIVLVDAEIAVAAKAEDPSSAEYKLLLNQREALVGQRDEAMRQMEVADSYIIYGQIPLLLFATYFLLLEVKQIFFSSIAEYFFNVWSYVDLLPPALTFAIVFQYHTDPDPQRSSTYETVLLGTCSFMMWLKVLYFMRIFKKFSYLIRMIINVVKDMIPFLTVLLFAMIAFADAFYAVSAANVEPFIDNFTMAVIYIYNMCLGAYENEYGESAPTFAYVMFLLCTLFNMIVMFNLLIAIISETFAKVNENATQAGFQERAALISENIFLVPQKEIDHFYDKGSYLYKVINLDKTFSEEEQDEQKEQIQEIHRLVNKIEMRLNQQWGPLKIKKAPKKRNLPKSPEEVNLGDRCDVDEHDCVLKKSKGKYRWACDMRHELEDGCLSGFKDFGYHDDGERMRCEDCDFDSCFKCSRFLAYKQIHRKAFEEDNEEEIVP